MPDEIPFEQFFADRIKAKGYSLKKVADLTGIAPSHIENLIRGDFGNLPAAPYFRGYLIRLGKTLDFDGEEWWKRLKGGARNSGAADQLPRNRFMKMAPPKYLWLVGAGVIVLIYLAFQFTRIVGKPTLAVTFPAGNPATATQNPLTLAGTVRDADSLYLQGANGSQEQIPVNPDGSWQKSVLLTDGPNSFKITAQKFLGGETDITEQVWYESPSGPTNGTSSSSPSIHFESSTPATGTYFE
ncbi:MAG TPA: helix-turn-helix domain-containing protein [Candidatus Paceibacterota bacterium]|nr:helix-turn-helix domain-containing protein [Candidatus Paceibacterota bacterium]